jgi:hypothetical protein
MKISNLTENKNLITEGWNDPEWTLVETKMLRPWIGDIENYVVEAQLSSDQINQLFTSVEQGATASGGNRTAIGKGADVAAAGVGAVKDAAKFIDNKINELGKLVQNAGPVKNADAKFEELKAKIGAKDSKIVQAVKAVSDWAKANPGKASIAVGVLTAAAAMAGGPLGGAIAGFLSRATKDLLQGEKLSTAVGKSIKTGVYGFLAGMAFKYITDNILDNIAAASDAELAAMEQGFKDANFESLADMEYAKAGLEVGALDGMEKIKLMGELNAFEYSYNTVMNPQQLSQFNALEAAAEAATKFSPEHYAAAAKLHDFMIGVQNNAENIRLTGLWDGLKSIPRDMLMDDQIATILTKFDSSQELIGALGKASQAVGSAIQGAVQTADDQAKNAVTAKPVDAETKKELEADANQSKGTQESRRVQSRTLSEGQVYLLFNRLAKANDHLLQNKLMFESVFDAIAHYNRQTINEAPGVLSRVGGALKKAGTAAAGAIKGAAKQVTTKVTAEKLNTAWKKAGSPTDSDEIYDIIKGMGVADDVIKGTYDSMQIKPPATTDAPDGDKDADAADQSTGNATDATAGDAGGDTKQTNEPVSAPAVGTTTDTSGGSTRSGAATPAPATTGSTTGSVPGGNARPVSKPVVASVNLPKLADQIKKAGPQVVRGVKELIAA